VPLHRRPVDPGSASEPQDPAAAAIKRVLAGGATKRAKAPLPRCTGRRIRAARAQTHLSTPLTYGGINPGIDVLHPIGWLRRHGCDAPTGCCGGHSMDIDHSSKRTDPGTNSTGMITYVFIDRSPHRNNQLELCSRSYPFPVTVEFKIQTLSTRTAQFSVSDLSGRFRTPGPGSVAPAAADRRHHRGPASMPVGRSTSAHDTPSGSV
jgi:hypothetical protein